MSLTCALVVADVAIRKHTMPDWYFARVRFTEPFGNDEAACAIAAADDAIHERCRQAVRTGSQRSGPASVDVWFHAWGWTPKDPE